MRKRENEKETNIVRIELTPIVCIILIDITKQKAVNRDVRFPLSPNSFFDFFLLYERKQEGMRTKSQTNILRIELTLLYK